MQVASTTGLPRVLLVDDSWYMRLMVQGLLEPEGYEVICAESVAEAVRMYAKDRPDLVLMDLVLPTLDGLSGIAQLRALDPQAQVVVVTGCLDDTTRRQVKESGARAFVAKPVASRRLMDAIEGVLRGGNPVAFGLQAAG